MIVNIEGHSGLVRDISSGAVVNVNRTEYENYIARKNQKATQSDEINNIKAELDQIKQMLQILIRDKNG